MKFSEIFFVRNSLPGKTNGEQGICVPKFGLIQVYVTLSELSSIVPYLLCELHYDDNQNDDSVPQAFVIIMSLQP